MGKCVYLRTGTIYSQCTSKKHPNYDKSSGCAPFGANCPKSCNSAGKGCPVFKKEKSSKR